MELGKDNAGSMASAADILSGAIGLVVGAGGATVKYALAQRARVHEDLWGRRLDPYREVWALTSQFSRWPRQSPTLGDVQDLHERFRRWYYGDGGILMSARARRRYEFVQKGFAALCGRGAAPEKVKPGDYDGMMEIMSRFRTALTDDLESRRKRSLVWSVVDARDDRRAVRDLEMRVARLQATVTVAEAGHE